MDQSLIQLAPLLQLELSIWSQTPATIHRSSLFAWLFLTVLHLPPPTLLPPTFHLVLSLFHSPVSLLFPSHTAYSCLVLLLCSSLLSITVTHISSLAAHSQVAPPNKGADVTHYTHYTHTLTSISVTDDCKYWLQPWITRSSLDYFF